MSALLVVVIMAVIGWLITLAGWVIIHMLSLRAQNQGFVNEIMNEARLDVTSPIRAYQDWLSAAINSVIYIKIKLIQARSVGGIDWLIEFKQLGALFWERERALGWLIRLEEYDILFPAIRACRQDLSKKHVELQAFLIKFIDSLYAVLSPSGQIDVANAEALLEEVESEMTSFIDMQAMMEDLRIYLQNTTLGKILKREVPVRAPRDKSLPMLKTSRAGDLEISGRWRAPRLKQNSASAIRKRVKRERRS